MRQALAWLFDSSRNLAFIEHHQGIHCHYLPLRSNHQWIDIHFPDIRTFDSQLRQTQQNIDQLIDVCRCLTPEIAQELSGRNFFNHAPGLCLINRSYPEYRIGQHLRKNASESEHDHRAKLRVPEQAGNELPPSMNEWGNQASLPIIARQCFDDAKSFTDFACGFQVCFYQPALCFMKEICSVSLGNNRETDFLRVGNCFLFIHSHPVFNNRNTISA
ncbi:MAG: hypothetical protein BWX99_02832 [Deltaproteobacteria bacterium ADurb.Bin151]|nr:MAG: hypothetical protein BWX99_02832 [Deltaproteobacteria bacterium ADurb.Bin151]